MSRRYVAADPKAASGGRRAAAIWDKLFRTFYDRPERPEKSLMVFNRGYTEAAVRAVSEQNGTSLPPIG